MNLDLLQTYNPINYTSLYHSTKYSNQSNLKSNKSKKKYYQKNQNIKSNKSKNICYQKNQTTKLKKSGEYIENHIWPAKTKKNTDCLICKKNQPNYYCHIHANIIKHKLREDESINHLTEEQNSLKQKINLFTKIKKLFKL